MVPRRRLLDLMHSNSGAHAQTLCAPAGYGKTTILIDFVGELDAPICWYSLDSSDQDPRQLLDGLVAAVRRCFPDFGEQTRSRLIVSRDASGDASQLVGVLTGEMYAAIPDYFVLVLEDFHLVEESEPAKKLINLLLERSPENCHLIISSRTPIELPALCKLYLQKQAAGITASDLAFTPHEVRELSALLGLNYTDEEADALATQSEGWIISILLSTYTLRAGKLHKDTVAVSRKSLFRYLSAEVFDKQPSEIRSFLMESSTLDELEPEVCDQLVGLSCSRRLLDDIQKRNLFIQCIDDDNALFRYHQLFREFLQKKLLEQEPEKYLSLHDKAASLFEKACRWSGAVSHFLASRHYAEAARVIKMVGPELQRAGKWTTVLKWVRALPETEQSADPEIILLYAQGLVHLGDADGAARLLTGLLSRIQADSWLLKAKALSWRSAAFRITGYFTEARTDIEAAICLLERYGGPADILGDAYRRLGVILADQGQFPSAIRYLKRALKHFSALLDVAQMAEAHNWLGVMYKRMGDLEKASTHLEHARSEWLRVGNQGALAMALNNIAYIYQRRGQHDMALDTLSLGLAKARAAGYRRIESCLLIAQAEVLRDIGRYGDSLASYQQGLDLAREIMESYYIVWAKAGMGETYRLLGDKDKAEVLVTEAIAQAKEQGQHYEATLFTTQLGVIQYERGDFGRSRETLGGVCKRLTGFGDKDALARAYFHLAQVEFLSREHDSAMDWLSKATVLADELGYDDFLAVEGRNATMLIELAISRHFEEKRFLCVADKIRRRRVAPVAKTDTDTEAGGSGQCDIEARCLGDVEVLVGSRRVAEAEWRSQRAKEIFFYLMSSPAGRTREEITADIWPDSPPAKATSNLHINLYRARRAVHPLVIITDGSRYRINPHLKVWFDVIEFNQLLSQAESLPLHDKRLASSLEQVIQLYRGPFLSEVYSEWVERKRQDLEGKFLKALYLLARLDGESNRHARAVSLLEKFIDIDPYQDDVYCQLMEEHLALGDAASASRAYQRYVEGVAREMNCLPSVRMSDLHLRLFTRTPSGN